MLLLVWCNLLADHFIMGTIGVRHESNQKIMNKQRCKMAKGYTHASSDKPVEFRVVLAQWTHRWVQYVCSLPFACMLLQLV